MKRSKYLSVSFAIAIGVAAGIGSSLPTRLQADDTEVYLGDTMGDVPLFYAAANVAFVGGSLVPIGGHNLLEPAALGRPVVTGPHLFHTQDIAGKFEKVGASIAVDNATELGAAVADLFADETTATEIGKRGLDIVQQNKGALDRLLKLLEPLLSNVR